MNKGNPIVRMNIIPFSLKFHQTNVRKLEATQLEEGSMVF